MRRTLSSKDAFLYRYIYPLMVCLVFAAATVMAWRYSFNHSSGLITLAKWLIPVFGAVFTVFGIWYGRCFIRVQSDDTALYVSNYKTEIRVPFSDIENVWAETRLTGKGGGMDIIKIEFYNPTILGKQIQFIAAQSWNPSHSIVAELRELKDRASTQQGKPA
jgi:hypothetical protein